MNYFNKSNQKGSALIATLIIVAAISMFVLTIGDATVNEIRTSTSLEDSTMAYAAAEAGIEDGLLRYRFNQNLEFPVSNMTATKLSALRVDLKTGETKTVDTTDLVTNSATDSVYDLRVWYKAPSIGSDNLSDPNYPTRLIKDQALELDVSALRGQSLTLTYQAPTGYTARIETKVVQLDSSGADFAEVSKQLTDLSSSRSITIGPIPSGSDGLGYLVRIRPFIFDVATGQTAADTSYINYKIVPETAGSLLDTGTTYIESTGYFGGARRKIVAKIDRKSGNVYGIFDHVLFTGSDQNLGL